MRHTLILLSAMALAVAVALPASAADNGFDIGAAAGGAALNTGDLTTIEIKDDTYGYKVFAGGRFLTFFGVEGAYTDLGTAEHDEGSTATELSLTGFDVQAVGYIPLVIADIFVKAGMFQWEAELTGDDVGGPSSFDGTDPVYGAGIQFRFKSLAVRGEAEYFDTENMDQVLLYSVGLSYTF